MIDLTYKSRLLGMLLDIFPERASVEGDEEIHHALNVVSQGQANRIFALCKAKNKEELTKFIKELQAYAIK